ncbi:MAG: SET domain-containing protein [Anaerolineales bacterium]|nr:SET domain-containing protein [Anaerolineales bacterium]MCB8965513.1 SET domain-containing protein [Ardenticatenaceae bacterium]
MIHPATELRFVNPVIGYGVFATAVIPTGTIVYVQDRLEHVIHPNDPIRQDPAYKAVIEKYSFRDEAGNYVVSWDFAKYVNHCCHANTLSTGYGFEIAVRDILPGEEITDEYALFGHEEMPLLCHYADCRQHLRGNDMQVYGRSWDTRVRQALQHLSQVSQPLFPYLDAQTYTDLMTYLSTGEGYRPLLADTWHAETV